MLGSLEVLGANIPRPKVDIVIRVRKTPQSWRLNSTQATSALPARLSNGNLRIDNKDTCKSTKEESSRGFIYTFSIP